MDMQDFVTGCKECDPTSDPERAAELLRAGAELGEAILKKRRTDKVDHAAVIDSYNAICGGRLPKVTKLTDKRKRSIKNCLAQGFTVNDLSRAFKAAVNTPFLIGKNDRCWTANFDFIIKPDNIVKILEGAYGGAASVPSAAPAAKNVVGEHSYDLDLLLEHAMNQFAKKGE